MPFFSVIIPLYNKASFVRKTLDSVLNQNFEDYEVIIVNDGSTDNGLELIQRYSNSKIKIINQVNQGVSIARNNGIRVSKGKYISFLDADDLWKKNHLSEVFKAAENYPHENVFCSNYEVFYSEKKIKRTNFSIPIKNKYTLINNFFKASLKSSIALTSGVTVKKQILAKNLFDPNIKSGQDTDMWIRLALKHSFVFINTVTLTHFKSINNSLSKSNLIDDRILAIEKHSHHNKNHTFLHKYLDYNKFSVSLQYKRIKEYKKAYLITKSINSRNLSLKQQVLLKLPRFTIKLLDYLNKF